MHRYILTSICLSLAADQPATAQTTLRYLAVGVSEAPKSTAKQLQFAHKDALDFERICRTQAGKLHAQTEGTTLINKQATRAAIVAALHRLAADAKAGDTVMIALCGHAGGVGMRGEWGFVPFDFDAGDSASTALTSTVLRQRLTELASRSVTVVLILDCCHAGAFNLGTADFVVFAACLPQETSRESVAWNNGLFTMAFIEALEGKADLNGDGLVTLAETDAYVTSRVAQVLRDQAALGARSPEAQNPSCGRPTSIRSSLPLARVTPRHINGNCLRATNQELTMGESTSNTFEDTVMANEASAKARLARQGSDEELVNRMVEKLTPRIEHFVQNFFRDPDRQEDLRQSVVRSLKEHHGHKIAEIRGSEEVWQLVSAVTLRHCEKHKKRLYRDGLRGPKVHIGGSRDDGSRGGFDPVDSDASPVTNAVIRDLIRWCNDRLTDRQKHIFALHLEDRTSKEISGALRISIPTVDRELKKIRTILAPLLAITAV
jgi:DNA-directed RNA polymerase specialized sigma24 family protein